MTADRYKAFIRQFTTLLVMAHLFTVIGNTGTLTQHIRDSESVWAARLARAAGQGANAGGNCHPWTRITALFLLQHHPLLSSSSMLTVGAAVDLSPNLVGKALPEDFGRIRSALHNLPMAKYADMK